MSISAKQPREALLKYADEAEKDPKFTGGKRARFDHFWEGAVPERMYHLLAAWRINQPNPVWDNTPEEEEEN